MKDRLAVLKAMFPSQAVLDRARRAMGMQVSLAPTELVGENIIAYVESDIDKHTHHIYGTGDAIHCDCEDAQYNLRVPMELEGGVQVKLCKHMIAYLTKPLDNHPHWHLLPETIHMRLYMAYFREAYGLPITPTMLETLVEEYRILEGRYAG